MRTVRCSGRLLGVCPGGCLPDPTPPLWAESQTGVKRYLAATTLRTVISVARLRSNCRVPSYLKYLGLLLNFSHCFILIVYVKWSSSSLVPNVGEFYGKFKKLWLTPTSLKAGALVANPGTVTLHLRQYIIPVTKCKINCQKYIHYVSNLSLIHSWVTTEALR